MPYDAFLSDPVRSISPRDRFGRPEPPSTGKQPEVSSHEDGALPNRPQLPRKTPPLSEPVLLPDSPT